MTTLFIRYLNQYVLFRHRPAQRGHAAKHAGDKGNKFSTGAEKVGAAHNWDAAQEAYLQAQEDALAARIRHQSGGSLFGNDR